MIALQPSRIVLHCGLHKTGSTYLQRNCQTNRALLLKHGVLYLGPNTLKKGCRELWSFLQWGRWTEPPTTKLREQTRRTLLELAGEHPGEVHTILISFESIFGTLRTGLIKAGHKKKRPAKRAAGNIKLPTRSPSPPASCCGSTVTSTYGSNKNN